MENLRINQRSRAPLTVTLGMMSALLAGCTTESTTPPPKTTQASSAPSEGTTIFSDIHFEHAIGKTTFFDIVCIYRKDEQNPSVQPYNATAYYVNSTYPANNIKGFVDPKFNIVVTGSSPDCGTSGAAAVPTTSSSTGSKL